MGYRFHPTEMLRCLLSLLVFTASVDVLCESRHPGGQFISRSTELPRGPP